MIQNNASSNKIGFGARKHNYTLQCDFLVVCTCLTHFAQIRQSVILWPVFCKCEFLVYVQSQDNELCAAYRKKIFNNCLLFLCACDSVGLFEDLIVVDKDI